MRAREVARWVKVLAHPKSPRFDMVEEDWLPQEVTLQIRPSHMPQCVHTYRHTYTRKTPDSTLFISTLEGACSWLTWQNSEHKLQMGLIKKNENLNHFWYSSSYNLSEFETKPIKVYKNHSSNLHKGRWQRKKHETISSSIAEQTRDTLS